MTLETDVLAGCQEFTVALTELLEQHDFKVHGSHAEITETGIVFVYQSDMFKLPITDLEAKLKELIEDGRIL